MKRNLFMKIMGASLTAGALGKILPLDPNHSEGNKMGPKIVKSGEGESVNVWGDMQTHKLTGKDTDGKFFEWYSDVEPGVGIPPHYHTKEEEVFRILQGNVEFMIDGDKLQASAGDLVFAAKMTPHAWKAVGTEKVKMIVSVYPAGLEHMFEWMATLPPGPPTEEAIFRMRDEYGIHFV